jgi:hypothetical protein
LGKWNISSALEHNADIKGWPTANLPKFFSLASPATPTISTFPVPEILSKDRRGSTSMWVASGLTDASPLDDCMRTLDSSFALTNPPPLVACKAWYTHFGSRGRITRITRCSVDVRWAGNIISNKRKSSCMIVTDEVVATRRQSVADGYDPDTEIFAVEAFPILARLMVRGAIMSGVDAEEFEELLETLRIQFENSDLQGLVNNDVERGVTE